MFKKLIFLALLLSIQGLYAQNAQPDLSSLDTYIEQARQQWEIPGLSIAVVKDGEVVFAKGYGLRELGRPEPVDQQTIFGICSTTKAMTAAAIGMLVDEEKLDWNDPVVEHLPDFQLYDPYSTRQLRVKDLLTHNAGLGNADFLWYGQE